MVIEGVEAAIARVCTEEEAVESDDEEKVEPSVEPGTKELGPD